MKSYVKQTIQIIPDEEQKDIILTTCLCCRRVFNYFLDVLKEDNRLTVPDLYSELVFLKKKRAYLKEADSRALQSALCYLYNTFKNNPSQQPIRGNIDRWKYVTRRVSGIKVKDTFVQIPKLGWVELTRKPILNKMVEKVAVRADIGSDKYFVELFWKE